MLNLNLTISSGNAFRDVSGVALVQVALQITVSMKFNPLAPTYLVAQNTTATSPVNEIPSIPKVLRI